MCVCTLFGHNCTNEKDIIDVIGRRTLKERHELRLRYAELYREDLVDVLNAELSGDFRQLAKYLFFGPIQVLALQLYKLLKTEGTADTALIDIICCCSPTDLSALQKVYKEDTSRTLANDVEKRTNGTLREYMILFLNTERKAFSFAQLQTAVTTADWDVLVNFQEAENKAERIFSAVNT
ncbi:unnamed protein product [Dibothriocephalus latus]|uniref:Annexin n=1 Tax=Dibothriocephalus latus TaxID=60516 RepID=A0A3P7LTZ8_DIBLA|nr:unnamed protein product [Dibothriocephalus latus]